MTSTRRLSETPPAMGLFAASGAWPSLGRGWLTADAFGGCRAGGG